MWDYNEKKILNCVNSILVNQDFKENTEPKKEDQSLTKNNLGNTLKITFSRTKLL